MGSRDVEHPSHYTNGDIETMDAMRSMMTDIGVTPFQAYWWGNAFKYIWRWHSKGGVQDLEKAKRCIEYLIEEVERDVGDRPQSP